MVELFAGRYGFVDLLGSGGMGTVWRVWDAKRREYCAAKLLSRADSTSLLRFIRETSWRVEHEHVVTPTGWAAEDDRVLFTMPLIRGGTVGDLVRDFGALPDALAADLTGQLLAALAAVHAAGLVHRDVKPSNLLLDPPGSTRPALLLTDFGIAAHVDDPRLTRAGEAVGTRGYVAPEVLAGADPAPAQDVYAVGVLLGELLTGERPPPAGPRGLGGLRGHRFLPLVEALTADDPACRPTAAAALTVLRSASPDPGHVAATGPRPAAEGDVEVFDHVPDLPSGWTADGPADAEGPPSAPPRPDPVPAPDARTARMPDASTARVRTATTAPFAPAPEAPAPAATPRAAPPTRRGAPWVPVAVLLLLVGAALLVAGGVLLLRG